MEKDNTIENLKKLKQLYDEGTLTEKEFTEQKRSLLHLPKDEPAVPEEEPAAARSTDRVEQPSIDAASVQEEQEKRKEYTAKAVSGAGKVWHMISLAAGWAISVFFLLGSLVDIPDTVTGAVSAFVFAAYMCPLVNQRIKSGFLRDNQILNIVVGIALFILCAIAHT